MMICRLLQLVLLEKPSLTWCFIALLLLVLPTTSQGSLLTTEEATNKQRGRNEQEALHSIVQGFGAKTTTDVESTVVGRGGLRGAISSRTLNEEAAIPKSTSTALQKQTTSGSSDSQLPKEISDAESSSIAKRELATNKKKKKKRKKRRKKRRKKPKFQTTITAAPIVSSSGIQSNNAAPTQSPGIFSLTAPPTTAEKGFTTSMVSLLVETGTSSLESLTTDGTAQKKALDWILDDLLSFNQFYISDYLLIQRYIAAVFAYSMTSGLDGTWLSHTTAECSWTGLSCAGAVVREVMLVNISLSGSLPDETGSLSALTSLSLDDNSLSGTIPESTSQLTSLVHFSVDNNFLTGTLPIGWDATNFRNIVELTLGNNQFIGSVPSAIFGLPKVKVLELLPNNFTNSKSFPSTPSS